MAIKNYFNKPSVLQAAINAGKAITEVYEQEDYEMELKEDSSPLTIADKKSHHVLEESLSSNFDIPILSEEGQEIPFEERKKWGTYWLIDPLDGTKEFINRNGEFTVNVALIKENIPVEGVIYVPVSKTLYFGSKDLGAFKVENCPDDVEQIKEAEVIQLPQITSRDKFIIVGSRSHMSEETQNFVTQMKKEHTQVEMISKGSSLKLCMVAEGNADTYPRYAPTMEWDTGAGDAICRAAGFKVLQYQTDKPLEYNKENLLNPWFLVC